MSSLDTNLNTSPYYDDYSDEKNFHRVLFKPSVPIQARELTQLQTILQTQIERFGSNILKNGTIVSGCSFSFQKLSYVKLSDRDTDSNTYVVSSFSNGFFVDESSNLTFQVTMTKSGFEVTNPDLNTIIGNYLNSGSSNNETFTQGQTLKFYPSNGQINSTVTIVSGGTSYTNGDTLTFTSTSGTGATGNVTTNTTGGITAVTIITAGRDYKYNDVPTIGIVTSTGSGANLTVSINSTSSFTVANNTFETGNSFFNVVGEVATMKVGDGIVYQKGNFIRVDEQKIVINDYDPTPNGFSVGFNTTEQIVNSTIDSTLLDNAAGFNNENAPGADRLKLTPTLIVNTTSNSDASNNFLTLVRYEDGHPVVINQTTEYSKINDEIAKRTFDESGNYVTKPFALNAEQIDGNANLVNITVSRGIAYVKGYRNETVGLSKIPLRKALDTANVDNASVSQSIGNYVIVNEFVGYLPAQEGVTVSLCDTAADRISSAYAVGTVSIPTANSTEVNGVGNVIGTARARAIRNHGGVPGTPSAEYKLYLFDVTMNQGKNFADVKSVASNNTAIADVVLENSKAVLKDTDNRTFITRLGQKAIKTFNHKTSNEATYIFRSANSTTVQANGSASISTSGNAIFDYTASSYLSEEDELDFIVVNGTSNTETANLTGTVTVSSSANTVTGSGTDFVTDFRVGDYIRVASGGSPRQITGITNTIYMTVQDDFASSASSNTFTRFIPERSIISLSDASTSNVEVDSTQKSITINTLRGKSVYGGLTFNVDVFFNVKKNESREKTKVLSSNTYIKVDCSTNAGGTTGPWSIGFPDVYDIQKVYVHTSYTEDSTYDKTDQFYLLKNQKDGYYGLSQLALRSDSTLSITASSKITVVVRAFTTTGAGFGYFTVDSYPIDDSSTTLPLDKIRTQDISVYRSQLNGDTYDLRNCLDYRPYAANTANYANVISSATVDPNTSISFSGEQYIAAPGETSQLDYQYYLPRVDALTMTKRGNMYITEGYPSSNPSVPETSDDEMLLAVIKVPAYPTLAPKESLLSGRTDYAVSIKDKQLVRYTMRDIKSIDKRLQKIEYYTSLNLLEQQASKLQIPSSANSSLNRFKNGIVVDNFRNYRVSALTDKEFKSGVDKVFGQLTPRNRQFNIDLQVNTASSNTVLSNGIATLTFDHKEYLYQKSATTTRNAAELFYKYNGTMILLPDYDNYFDVSTNPTGAVDVEIDLTQADKMIIQEINDMEAYQRPTSEVIGTTVDTFVETSTSTEQQSAEFVDRIITSTTETTTTITTSEIQDSIKQITYDEVSSTQKVGTFVTDLSMSPYIREQDIEVYVFGLKPNSTHYVYFDGVDVASSVTPCIGPADNNIVQGSLRTAGAKGDAVVTNGNGEAFFILHIAGSTYNVGSRSIVVSEKSTFADIISTSRSKAVEDFNAYNFGIDKTDVNLTIKSIKPKQSSVATGVRTFTESSVSRKTTSVVTNVQRNFDNDDSSPDGNDGADDPLAQTFKVTLPIAKNTSGIFASKLDLFFQSKDPNLGCLIEIREVVNGYPSPKIIPGSQVHLRSSDVNLSEDGSVATSVTFEYPVYLPRDKEFCFVIIPDGNNPNYNIFVRKTGQNDLITGVQLNNDNFDGSCFTSTNNSTWQALIDEDIKFILYSAEFNQSTGTVTFNEGDYEFFTASAINNQLQVNERVFKYDASANIAGTLQVSNTSETITGTSTTFTTDLVAGDYIVIDNGSDTYDIKKVTSITNNTSLSVQGYVNFTNNVSVAYKTPTAVVKFKENSSNFKEVFVANSTASNATFKFSNGDVIIGETSSANVTISTVDDIGMSSFENLIYTFSPSDCRLTQSMNVATSSGWTANTQYPINNRNYFTTETVIKSKSNSLNTKSIHQTVTLTSGSDKVSPVLDTTKMSIVKYYNLINNVVTDEYISGSGQAIAKYVSKSVTLDDELDAEDFRVYLTANKPTSSQIHVYIKASNELETDNFIDRQWTKLTLQGDDSFTDVVNKLDYKEYEYRLPNSPVASSLDGKASVTSGSATITSTVDHETAGDLAVGDLIKVVNTDTEIDYQIEVITAISGTTITVGNNISFTNSQADIYKVTETQTIFKDPQNNFVATYFNSNQNKFETFKFFQIKIVMTSSDASRAPRIDNYRAIALSI